jgi:hypothetical protein
VDGGATRCTAVELSTCRQQEAADLPTAGQQPSRSLTCAKRSIPQLPHL